MNRIASLLVTAITAAAVSVGVAHFQGGPSGGREKAKETVYERIVRTNVLRCGYIVYPPNLAKDPNTGAFSGISYDIVTRLARDLGLTVEWTEEPGTASMIEGLNAGRYDVMCSSVWASTARGKAAAFSTPLYYTAINAYARADDTRFRNGLTSVEETKLTIATIDGGGAAAIAREDFPQAKTYSLPELTDFSHLLLAVKDKHADITFSEDAQAAAFAKANPGTIRNVSQDRPVRLFANAFMMRMGETQFADMMNNAISNLHNNGFIEKTLAAHEGQLGHYRRVAPAFR